MSSMKNISEVLQLTQIDFFQTSQSFKSISGNSVDSVVAELQSLQFKVHEILFYDGDDGTRCSTVMNEIRETLSQTDWQEVNLRISREVQSQNCIGTNWQLCLVSGDSGLSFHQTCFR